MCTGISTYYKGHYFGRSLDVSMDFPFEVLITPRNFNFPFPIAKEKKQLSMIGMGMKVDNYPLYFDAMNECGLAMAGLNFPEHAYYSREKDPDKLSLASFELMQFILSQAKTVAEGKILLKTIQINGKAFNQNYPAAPLHWLLSDGKDSVVIESTKDGLRVYDNPYHILTNNPPFPYHQWNVSNYLHLTPDYPTNHFSKTISLKPNSIGLGSLGLPGDNSSPSRFIRGYYHLNHLELSDSEMKNIVSFFHVLESVGQMKGTAKDANQNDEYSAYMSCISQKDLTYYVKTYYNTEIQGIQLTKERQVGNEILEIPIKKEMDSIRVR